MKKYNKGGKEVSSRVALQVKTQDLCAYPSMDNQTASCTLRSCSLTSLLLASRKLCAAAAAAGKTSKILSRSVTAASTQTHSVHLSGYSLQLVGSLPQQTGLLHDEVVLHEY